MSEQHPPRHPDDRDREPRLEVVGRDHPDGREPPHDENAERVTIGALLQSPAVFHDVVAIVEPSDFYIPRHELIYNAACTLYAAGEPVDVVTVAHQLQSTSDLARAGGAPYLHECISTVPVVDNGRAYARIIRDQARARRLVQVGHRITQLGHTAGDPHTLSQAAVDALATATRDIPVTSVRATDLDDFLNTDDPDYEWLIPGFLERRDRFMLTAGEGHGKSTLLRQWAIQAASGIHPFTLTPIDPIRVLLVDLENSEAQTRRKYRALRQVVGDRYHHGQLHLICKPDGLDLANPDDETWLANLVTAHRADLVLTGPVYKLAGGDPTTEKDSKPAAMALDRIREASGAALVLEAHSKKAEGTDPKKRSKDPFGWSGWLRWPEFGYHLAEDGTLTHWRGPRDQRDIPTALNRGGTWPWTPTEAADANDNEARWQACRRAIWQAGQKLSIRELANATGMSKSTVDRVLGIYAMQHAALLAQLGNDDQVA